MKRTALDRLGCFSIGCEASKTSALISDAGRDGGKELEMLQVVGFGPQIVREIDMEIHGWDDTELVFKTLDKSVPQMIAKEFSGLASIESDDGKWSNLEFELLLSYLPAARDSWEADLANNRSKYAALKEEILNPLHAEADSYACFVRLLSDSVDHFCQHMDNSSVGIMATLSHFSQLIKLNDEELWRHYDARFAPFDRYASVGDEEFEFHDVMRIWDSLLSNPLGIQDMLLRVCCAMVLCVKRELLSGDFAENLKLLQHYPSIDIEYILHVSEELIR
ncbi:hypothetical protein QJS10_CPA07g00678 [Acorus calamus]|uniref:Rab-GAP TBC domain-containing protein n=1 Tax=Acorus calamus TaxID=4465 RepID=A0AAV9EH37_ACOCL|nr:hypothetical protein QJS10_CPA07g00678 [Acorus calamus]